MKIAIIGAGVAGLCSAKLLTEFGFSVTVFDKVPDLGGVWSRTRLYPGVTTQNGKDTYAFSDFPMPDEYPEWPTGAQVQRYLAAYALHFDLAHLVRLNTEVVSAELDEAAGRWTLTIHDLCTGSVERSEFDQLIVATGIFCDPFIPDYPGIEEFTRAGGRICAATEFNNLEDAVGKDVVVVGYGKSACDIAEALSEVAHSTTVAARDVTWKMPRKVGGVLNYKYLLLTRFSEALFDHIDQRGFARVITGPGRFARNALLGMVGRITRQQLMFDQLGLVPAGRFDRIVRHAVSLATEGFYEKIRDGVIDMRRGVSITGLFDRDGAPMVEFSDGTSRRVDAVVCATGYRQRTPFLSEDLNGRIADSDGNFRLYRQILPVDVPRLFFVGYGSSLLSPISAEAAAIWVVNYLAGHADLPPREQQRAFAARRLDWMIDRTDGKHANGTNIIPFSVRQIDELLDEVGVNVGRWTQLKQWLLPIRPAAYQAVTRALHRRIDGQRDSRHKELSAAESTL